MKRREIRIKAIEELYKILIYDEANVLYGATVSLGEFFSSLLENALNNKQEIIEEINKYLKDWSFDRLSKVDQAILLVGVSELLYLDTPFKVVINEYVEISKCFSDLQVVGMINTVLDKIYWENKDA